MNQLDYIFDIVYDVTGVELNDVELRKFVLKTPKDIRMIGEQWGCNDTVFREKLSLWLKNQDLLIEELRINHNR